MTELPRKGGSLGICFQSVLTTGQAWEDLGADHYARLDPDRAKNSAIPKLRDLGYE